MSAKQLNLDRILALFQMMQNRFSQIPVSQKLVSAVLFLFFFIGLLGSFKGKAQSKIGVASADSIWAPSFSSVGLGADIGFSSGNTDQQQVSSFKKFAAGASIHMNTSVLLTYFLRQNSHRLRIGDYFSGSLGLGGLQEILGGRYIPELWANYRFQVGMQSVYEICQKQRLGIKLIFLDFSHTQLIQNTSGSSIDLSYRVNRAELSIAAGALRDRFAGWLQIPAKLNTLPHYYSAECALYFSRRQKAGIREEWFSNKAFNNADLATNLNTRQLFLTHFYYALLF